MQSPAFSLAQSHLDELRRTAATSALRTEARRAGAEGLNPRPVRGTHVVRFSMVRRAVGRLAI